MTHKCVEDSPIESLIAWTVFQENVQNVPAQPSLDEKKWKANFSRNKGRLLHGSFRWLSIGKLFYSLTVTVKAQREDGENITASSVSGVNTLCLCLEC